MNKQVSMKILESPKLLEHLKEQSYWFKNLNRTPKNLNVFQKEMKYLYKERVSDKLNDAIDGIDAISMLIEGIN